MTSYVTSKEQCPSCARLGKDNNKDNLAVYSDGHKFCYSCKYTEFPNGIQRLKQELEEYPYEPPYLPVDCDILYPQRALDWVAQYELTKNDLYKHNVLWSETMQRLIFPVYGDGLLIAWQGRSFNLQDQAIGKIPKWYGKGNLKDTFNLLGKGDKLVLVEDIVSAIKVSKCGVMALPLYGSFVGIERFKRIYSLFCKEVEVLIWLDPDKRLEAVKEAKLGMLLMNCRTIISDKDPKEHDFQTIKKILNIT